MFLKHRILLLCFVTLSATELYPQLCSGSLGDPIINITFESGTNPGPALSTTRNLQYINYDCPNDGSYTVRNNISSCFGNTWHTLSADHTGNTNGYLMLVNASLQKSEFYIDTVKGLCPNTTYEFASWLMNVILPSACGGNTINPNITFNIEKKDGTILQSYSTGDIFATASPQWKQYGFFFTTQDASEVVVRMINNSVGGCGNDLAIDDITFRACGSKLTPFIAGTAGNIKELCIGDVAEITLSCDIEAGYSNPSYQWQQSTDNGSSFTNIPGATTQSFVKNITAQTSAGSQLYRIIVADGANISLASCRIASSPLTIRIYDKPAVRVTSNSPVCEGSPVILSASGGNEYQWSGPNDFAASGMPATISRAVLSDAGMYYATITSAGGCRQTDSATIAVNPQPVASAGFGSVTICQGENVTLTSDGGISYLWSPSAGLSSIDIPNPYAQPADTTLYTVEVQNELGCKDSATVIVNVAHPPTANAGADQNIVEGQSVQLLATATGGGASYTWTPGQDIDNIHTLQPIVSPASDITYVLTVSSDNGCGISADSVAVRVYKKITIPNAFSPNNDGINDTWNITALNSYTDHQLSVFNRYGHIVFSTTNYRPWNGNRNGTPLPTGTYYYIVDVKQGLPKLSGFVVILR